MKLLLFGGTFDPPHIGHMNLLKNAIEAVRPDMVLVVPAGTPPHKAQSTTSGETRLAMCSCFAPLFGNIAVSDIEIKMQGKSYTVNTINALLQQMPQAEIYLCIGSDSLIDFTLWYRYKEILQKTVLVAMCRKKEDETSIINAAKILKAEGGRVIIATGKVEEISSSGIRAAIANGDEGIYSKIPPPADLIVKQQSLYREKTGGLFS